MATLAKRLPLILATLVLSTTLLGFGAYAATPASDATITAITASDPAGATIDSRRGTDRDRDRDGDHHRRLCVKLNEVLSRLVDNGVITREQKARIMDAFNCSPDDRPTPQPTAAPTTTAG